MSRPSSLVSVLLVMLSLALPVALARAETPKEFAQRIAGAMQRGDGSALDRAIDTNAILERAYVGIEVSEATRRDFGTGVKQTFTLGAQVAKEIRGSGSYELLRVRPVQGKQRALFRMVSPEGVNYHDMELAPARDGKGQRVVDIFVYMSGEWVSQSMRRGFLQVVAHEKRGAVDRMTGAQSAYIKSLPRINELTQASLADDYARVLAVHRSLPPEVQKDRNVMIMYYHAAFQVGDAERVRAREAIQKAFPKDPAFDLLLFDGYFVEKRYDDALAALERVRRALGGDAYLDFLTGNIFYARGDHAKAKVWLNRAITAEPDLADPYWTLITISLEQRTHDETARLLERVELNARVELQDVGNVSEYAAFAKSKAYAQWKQRWQQRQKTPN